MPEQDREFIERRRRGRERTRAGAKPNLGLATDCTDRVCWGEAEDGGVIVAAALSPLPWSRR